MPATRPVCRRVSGLAFGKDLARLLVIVVLAVAGIGPASAEYARPYVPANDAVVLQRVPPRSDPRIHQADLLRRDALAHPHDMLRAVALADAYIDYGRSTGDARYLGRAMAVIQPFLQGNAPPVSALLARATIAQSRHDFTGSRDELQRIVQRDPDNAQAWLTLANVAMVQGDYAAANHACVQLANAGGRFYGMACTSSLRSLDGHAAQAYVLLGMIEDPGPDAPPSIRAWIEGLMADTAARMGKADLADRHFRQALALSPGDNFLLADYGEFLLDHGRPADALALVVHDEASDTSFLVRVAAEVALKNSHAATDTAAMDARFAAMEERGEHLFLREQASFLLHVHHDAHGALALALRNWAVQRSPKDARILLEAAAAAHRPDAAEPVLAFIAAQGMRDDQVDPLVNEPLH